MNSKHTAQGRFGKSLRELFRYPVLVLFAAFFLGLFAFDLASPDRERSEMENTLLQQRPSLTVSDLTGGTGAKKLNDYFKKYEKYVKEQVVFRDGWISLYGRCQTLLFQKAESGGILLGKQHMMFPRTYSLLTSETKRLPQNLAAVCSLAQRYPGRVNVLLAPAASVIYPENVPLAAPLLDENSYLDAIFDAVTAAGANALDVRETLAAHKDEYLYYRTDHHWTTLGAYYAYAQLCETLRLTPFDPAAHTALTVPDFYGTHYAKARTPGAEADTITYYDLPNTLTVYTLTGASATLAVPASVTGLYDTAKFDVYDKYAAFLYGNNGYSRIAGDGEGSILVVKDSYANSFVPYLTANYENIDIVDFRNFNYGLDELIAANGYDQILVLYSFDSFKADQFLSRAGVAG